MQSRRILIMMCVSTLVAAGWLAAQESSEAPAQPGEKQSGVGILEAFPDRIQVRLEQRERNRRHLPKAINGAPLDFVLTSLSLWDAGQVVTVSFRGGDDVLYQKIATVADEWTNHGNLKFSFRSGGESGPFRTWSPTDTTYASDIRVSFHHRGYWSLVGRDSIDPTIVRTGEASLNLAKFHTRLPVDYAATVLHEFGHAIGFQHEHQSPRGGCDHEFRWDDGPDGTPGIYTVLSRPPNRWPRWKVDHNLRQLPDSDAYLVSRHDPKSIMHYSFDKWMFHRGERSHCYTGRNTTISGLDKEGMAAAYPSAPARIATEKTMRRSFGQLLSETKQRREMTVLQPVPEPVPDIADTPPVLAGEFRLNRKSFPSQRAFVDSGARCATPVPGAFELARTRATLNRFRLQNPQFRGRPTVVRIPVHFHVIMDTDGTGNLTEQVLDRQLVIMNNSFAGHDVEFVKAGVKRITNSRWFGMGHNSAAEREAKTALQIDPQQNLNFYTGGLTAGLLGWATFPWALSGDPALDGIVVLHSSLPGGSSAPYDEGDTAVHEVGHWLGLYHTFQGGCVPPGDEVDDTPAERSPASGCPVGRDSCPNDSGTDPVKNFMDYSDDSCMDHFTALQAGRMHEMIGTYRYLLLSGAQRGSIIPVDIEE